MFKKSDIVKDGRGNTGKVTEVSARGLYPIEVTWSDGTHYTYTAEGKLSTSHDHISIYKEIGVLVAVRYVIRNNKLVYESPHKGEVLVVILLEDIKIVLETEVEHYSGVLVHQVPSNVIAAIKDYLLNGEDI